MTTMTRDHKSRTVWVAALCAAVGVAAFVQQPRAARACGGFFAETNQTEVVAMSDIRVALVRTPGRVDQYVQVGYSGSVTDFAWVYPVDGNPDVVAEVKDSPFAGLEEATRPRITITTVHDDSGGGFTGCGGAADDSSGLGGYKDNSTKVWQSGQVGAFDYVVITATTADDMLDWLNKNGFKVPTAARSVVGHYVTLGWYFVAMRVSVKAASSGDVPATTVLRLGYPAKEVRYPLRMVSLSPAAKTSIELYLVTSTPNAELTPTAPFKMAYVQRDKVVATSSTTHNYETRFAQALAASGPRTLVKEYSSTAWDPAALKWSYVPKGSSLVRLRTSLGPDAMDEDIVFAETLHVATSSTWELVYDPDNPQPSAVPPLALLLVLGFAGRVLGRRWWPSSSAD